jgi:hypothetical protein
VNALTRHSHLHAMPDLTFPASVGFTYATPWWEDETSGLACNMSFTTLDDALTVRMLSRRNGSLAGVTIRSGKNPMDELIFSALGIILIGVYPAMLFSVLALYSFRLLWLARAQEAPKDLIVSLIIYSNCAICVSGVVLLCAGGGALGLLLPDWRRRWKTFNTTVLAGSSAAVDVLLALFIGDIIQQRPPHSHLTYTGLACFAAMVALDLAQAIGIVISWDMWTSQVLPGLLVLAELASSAFLARRCFVLGKSLQDDATDIGSSASAGVHAFHRRLVAAGVSAGRRDLAYICLYAYTLSLACSTVSVSCGVYRRCHLDHPLHGRASFHFSYRRRSLHFLPHDFKSLHRARSAPVCGPEGVVEPALRSPFRSLERS